MAYKTGITINERNVTEIMPPTIGAAMRRITSEPVLLPHMMGSRPVVIATIILGQAHQLSESLKA